MCKNNKYICNIFIIYFKIYIRQINKMEIIKNF